MFLTSHEYNSQHSPPFELERKLMFCSTHYHSSHLLYGDGNGHGDGDGDGDGDPFTITAFFVRLSGSGSGSEFNASKPISPIPDSLTLVLNHDTNSAAATVVSLRRLRLSQGDVIFGSQQKVRGTTQVVSFHLYFGEAKLLLLKGTFSITKEKGQHHHRPLCNLECSTCECDLQFQCSFSVSEAELCVGLDGDVAIRERIAIPTRKKPTPLVMNKLKTSNNKEKQFRSNKSRLEDIPEETELGFDFNDNNDIDSDSGEASNIYLEMDLEGLRRALDMGIWVLCLGFAVGYMVSRASITSFRPPPTFL